MEFLLGAILGLVVGAAFSKVWIGLWDKIKTNFDK